MITFNNKYLLVILSLLFVSFNTYSQWHIVRTCRPKTIDFVNDSTGIAIDLEIHEQGGSTSYLIKTIDYGITWDTIYTFPNPYFWEDAVFASENVIYACGDYIVKSIDGGQTWFNPCAENCPMFSKLWFTNELVGYGVYGDVFPLYGKTEDGGVTWTSVTNEIAGRDIHFYDECHGNLVIGAVRYTTENCGDDWVLTYEQFSQRTFNTIWFQNENVGYMGGMGVFGNYFDFNYATVLKTINGGDTWSIIDIPLALRVATMFWTSEEVGYIGNGTFSGYPYSIMKTVDAGQTWMTQEVEIPQGASYPSIGEIDCPSDSICYATSGKYIYKTINGGGQMHEAWLEYVVGIDENTEIFKMGVYPNPATDKLNVQLDKPAVVSIYTSTGQLVETHTSKSNYQIDVSHYPAGLYLVVSSGVSKRFVRE